MERYDGIACKKIKEFVEIQYDTCYTSSKYTSTCSQIYNGLEYLIRFHKLQLDNNNMIIFNNGFSFQTVHQRSLIIWWIYKLLNSDKNLKNIDKNLKNIEIYIEAKSGTYYIDIYIGKKEKAYKIAFSQMYNNGKGFNSEYLEILANQIVQDFTKKS